MDGEKCLVSARIMGLLLCALTWLLTGSAFACSDPVGLDLSQLRSLHVDCSSIPPGFAYYGPYTNSAIIPTNSKICATCPVPIEFTILIRVDQADNRQEDQVTLTHDGIDYPCNDSICPGDDTSGFHEQVGTYTKTIYVVPDKAVTLSLNTCDDDSIGHAMAYVLSAVYAPASGCGAGLGAGSGTPGCFNFAMGLGNSGGRPVGTLHFDVDNAEAKPSLDDLRYNGWAATAFSNGWPTSQALPTNFASFFPANHTNYFGRVGGVDVVTVSNRYQQIKTDQGLANFVPEDNGYAVQFYTADNVGTKTGTVYAVFNQPQVTWRFFQTVAAGPWTVQEIRGATTNTTTYAETSAHDSSSYTRGENTEASTQVRNVLLTQTDANGLKTNEILEIITLDATSNVCSKIHQQNILIGGGLHTILEVRDPDGLSLTNRWWFDGNGQQIASLDYKGAWKVTRYTGLVATEFITPWKNSPFDPSLLTDSTKDSDYCIRVIENLSQPLVNRDIITTTEYVPGSYLPTHKETKIWPHSFGTDHVATNLVYPGDGTCLTSGVLTIGGVQVMSFRPNGVTTLFNRSTDPVSSNITETTSVGAPNTNRTAILKGTRSVHITTSTGALLSESSYSIPENYLLSSSTITQRDPLGRPLQTTYLDGSTSEQTYNCCGVESSKDRDGVYTFNDYDSLKRLKSVTRAGETTMYEYDAAGRQVATWRVVTNTCQLVSRSIFDSAGRMVATVDALNHTNTFAESVTPEGYTVRTTTYADGTTRIERHFLDGQLESVSGTAVHPVRYDYAAVNGNRVTTQYKLGANDDASEWVKTITDGAGRSIMTVYADNTYSFNVYNSAGQLVRSVDPDGVNTLYAYNVLGEQEYTSRCATSDRLSIVLEGDDRITRTTADYALHGTDVIRRTVNTVWTNSGATSSNVVAIQDASLDGARSWSIAAGRTNFSARLRLGDGWVLSVATNADGSYSRSLTATGRLVSTESRLADGTLLRAATNSYDAWGRQLTTIDNTGLIVSNEYDIASRVVATTTFAPGLPSQTIRTTYDLMGRPASVIQPDGGVVTNEYYLAGEPKKTYGARTYPVEYAYDNQGRRIRLSTWQDFAGQVGRADTLWTFSPSRGFLAAKTYADSNAVTYTYTPAGRLDSRTWARGVQTRYVYNQLGDLSIVSYFDADGQPSTTTPRVVNIYDRLGRPCLIHDGSGMRTTSYTEAGAVAQDQYTVGLFAGHGLSRTYDALNRPSGLSVFSASGVDQFLAYGYDSASRLTDLQSIQSSAGQTNRYVYSYGPTGQWTNLTSSSNGRLITTTTRTLDGLNRLTSIIATSGVVQAYTGQVVQASTPASSYAYAYNSANQRTSRTDADGTSWAYAYDNLGQVTNGVHARPGGEPLLGQSFAYLYDDIGNRKTASRDELTENYSANALNQYTSRTIPNLFDILGDADTNTAITVNGTPAQRQDRYWRGSVAVDNSSAPVYASVVVTGQTATATNSQSGSRFVAQTPEVYAHDPDGNLLSDGRWTYAWDAENRLIAMETSSKVGTAVPAVRLSFSYDSQSRRVRKQVFTKNSDLWTLTSDLFFVYDGWNLVREERRPDTHGRATTMAYIWGLDLSSSMQGAGGIGGLLSETKSVGSGAGVPPATYFTCFDGNGNLTDLIDTNGATAAHYEYDPFGNTLVATGAMAKENPFRFSTKYTDDETGLLYYGFRYYSPQLGRWVSRDPAGIGGGSSEYAFLANTSVNQVDSLGLIKYTPDAPPNFEQPGFDIWITGDFVWHRPSREILQVNYLDWDITGCNSLGGPCHSEPHQSEIRRDIIERTQNRPQSGRFSSHDNVMMLLANLTALQKISYAHATIQITIGYSDSLSPIAPNPANPPHNDPISAGDAQGLIGHMTPMPRASVMLEYSYSNPNACCCNGQQGPPFESLNMTVASDEMTPSQTWHWP